LSYFIVPSSLTLVFASAYKFLLLHPVKYIIKLRKKNPVGVIWVATRLPPFSIMATEPDLPPVPRTPIHDPLTLAANPDPSSDCSTLTSLSSLSQSSGKSSSPSRSYSLNLELNAISDGNRQEKHKSDGETTPSATNTTRNDFGLPEEASDALKDILTPQKALPSIMTLVPDNSPSFLREPELHSTTIQRRKNAEGRSSSEQEIWIPNPGELLDELCPIMTDTLARNPPC
jgi:hypothetical protein